MKDTLKTVKLLNNVFAGLFLLGIIGLISFSVSNKSKKKELNKEKLINETILSEKLLLDKHIDRYKNENQSLKNRNNELDTLLFNSYIEITQKNWQINNIQQDNRNNVRSLELKLKESRKQIVDLNKKNDSLIMANNIWTREKNDLNKKNISLQNQINNLNDRIKDLYTVVADNYRIETKKTKKNMLTIEAKKTTIIQFGFDIPENINTDIKLRIINPKGYDISGSESGISYMIVDNPNNLTASISPEINNIARPNRIEMTFKPKEKLQFGIYKIEILNKDGLIGSCQFRLK
jgi:hypothetical protein